MWQAEIKSDIDSGSRPLYPVMFESHDLRWAFIRKVYSIITIQFLLTIVVSAVVISVHPIKHFFAATNAGLFLYIILIFVPFITMSLLYYYHHMHPLNYFLLGIFTTSLAFLVCISCAFSNGKVILEAAFLTGVLVLALTLYTYWATKRAKYFSFLGPFLFGYLLILVVFDFIQILFPLGKISVIIYGVLASIIFCGYIVYDTGNLTKRYSYDEYILAAMALYLYIIKLFLSLITIFRSAEI